jgi:RNA polymerase sigma-70 factor (ECF subfamily)
MLRKFPGVERWEQSDDVFQNAMLRLLAALETVNPENTRAFVGLCTEQIRRELIDLARHYGGRRGIGANHDSFFGTVAGGAANVVVTSDVPAIEVELWATFHEEMTKLPPDEREVVGLVYYHNWAQSEIGELLGVDERTVRRRLKSGLNRLREAMRNLGLEDVPDD